MSGRIRRALFPFDPRGRLSAPAYRHRFIRLLLTFFGLICFSVWLASFGLRGLALLAFSGNLLVLAAIGVQTIRRLHDRGRTGWWLGLYALLEAVSVLPLEEAADTHPFAVVAAVTAMLGFFAWFVIETLLRSGTPTQNRYGPAPTGGP